MNKEELIKHIFTLGEKNVVMLGFFISHEESKSHGQHYAKYRSSKSGPLGKSPLSANKDKQYLHLTAAGLKHWLTEEKWGPDEKIIADLVSERGRYYTYLLKMDNVSSLCGTYDVPRDVLKVDSQFVDLTWSRLKYKFWQHDLEYDMRNELQNGARVKLNETFKGTKDGEKVVVELGKVGKILHRTKVKCLIDVDGKIVTIGSVKTLGYLDVVSEDEGEEF